MTKTPTHLDAIEADLDRIASAARWAYGYGYEAAGRGLDPERGAALRARTLAEIRDPDLVPGDRYDLGIGEHRARLAWSHAVEAVLYADVVLAAVLRDCGETTQPRLPNRKPVDPDELARVVAYAKWRASHVPPWALRSHRRNIESVRGRLDRCVRGFSRALDQGAPEGIAHAEDVPPDRGIAPSQRCAICQWRKRRKKDGKRCPTCAKYLQRTGVERPRILDGINPIEAKKKRLARREGWGSA